MNLTDSFSPLRDHDLLLSLSHFFISFGRNLRRKTDRFRYYRY